MDRLPFAKPERVVDRKLLRLYCTLHWACEVQGCKRRPCPEPHHLRSRKMGRDDRHENLLRLCRPHHIEWHTLGGRAWFLKYHDVLDTEAIEKIARVFRLEVAA